MPPSREIDKEKLLPKFRRLVTVYLGSVCLCSSYLHDFLTSFKYLFKFVIDLLVINKNWALEKLNIIKLIPFQIGICKSGCPPAPPPHRAMAFFR